MAVALTCNMFMCMYRARRQAACPRTVDRNIFLFVYVTQFYGLVLLACYYISIYTYILYIAWGTTYALASPRVRNVSHRAFVRLRSGRGVLGVQRTVRHVISTRDGKR